MRAFYIFFLSLLILTLISCEPGSQYYSSQPDANCSALTAKGQDECNNSYYSCQWNIDKCEAQWKVKPPSLPEGLTTAKMVRADNYVCAIDLKDHLWCWTEFPHSHRQIHPHDSLRFKDVQTQGDRVCGVLQDNSGICFNNGKKEFLPATFSKNLAKLYPAGNKNTCAITQSGAIVCDGDNANLKKTIEGNFIDIGLDADKYAVALGQDKKAYHGKVNGRGWQDFGRLGSTGVIKIAVGTEYGIGTPNTCFVYDSGDLRCGGDKYLSNEIEILPELTTKGFSDVSTSRGHTCGILREDASPRCWGAQSKGQSAIDNNLKGIKQIAAGQEITCYIGAQDDLHCIGRQ